MSHIKIIASLLLLFFSLSVNAKAVCTLLEKDVELRKYSFKCNNETVNIQCEIKNKNVCSVNVKDKLESMKFSISDDELSAFNLFSKADLKAVECNTSKKLCETRGDVCDKYKNFFDAAKSDLQSSFRASSRCQSILGESVLDMANLSTEFVAGTEFKKNDCQTKYATDLQSIKNKISFFKSAINRPFLDRDSFFYNCVQSIKVSDPRAQDNNVLSKSSQLSELKNRILSKMQSNDYLGSTICEARAPLFFENGKLNVDNVMCAVIEESNLELSDKTISCGGSHGGKAVWSSNGRSSRLKSAEESGASIAKADATPLEQKPMPEAMASQFGKPVGLAPALAQVDQIAPGSGTAQGSIPSESNIAAGAVRNTIPTNIASQAGQAFAPVYEKLSVIGKSASTSVRPGIIGSGSPSLSGATGVVSVTRKPRSTSSDDSSGSIADIPGVAPVSVASAGLAKASAGKSSDGGTKASLGRTSANVDEASPALGGPRSLGLNGGGGSGGSGVTRSPSNADSSGMSDANTTTIVEKVQKKITQLNSPAQIASFFKEEAVNIPNLRELLYSDSTSKILASKGIRVVNQSGDESGETVAKAKYLYRDDGSKFTPLKLAKKN